LVLFSVFVFSCGSEQEKQEIANLHSTISQQQSTIATLNKKVDKLLLTGEMYQQYLSQINSQNIVDIYGTEIALGGVITPKQNINADYNLALLSIRYNRLEEAEKILLSVKENIKTAILVELDLQKDVSAQLYAQADGDSTSGPLKNSGNSDIDAKQTKSNLSQQIVRDGPRIGFGGVETQQISPIAKVNFDLVYDETRLKFFYDSLFEVNFLLGYINYAKKDYKNAVSFFMQNYNLDEGVAKLLPQEKLFKNVFALSFSFYKINRSDKFCELVKITKINDRRAYNQPSLYEQISAAMPLIDCENQQTLSPALSKGK